MGNVVPFEDASVPAHIAKRFAAGRNSDLSSGVGAGYAHITYRGKVWSLVDGENSQMITHEDGEPKSSIEVVILSANPRLSKLYYKSGYQPGSKEKPTCYSNDSVAPASDASEPQATKCGICPHNQWGSRISEAGSKGKACSDSRRLAVAPSNELSRALLLRVPAASLKELSAYAEMLNRRKASYNSVVTKITFDHTVAHPKFIFTAVRYLTDGEMSQVDDLMEKEIVAAIVASSGEATPIEVEVDAPAIEGTPPARKAKAAPLPPPPAADEEEEDIVVSPEVEEKLERLAGVPAKPAKADPGDLSLDDVLGMLDD